MTHGEKFEVTNTLPTKMMKYSDLPRILANRTISSASTIGECMLLLKYILVTHITRLTDYYDRGALD